MQETWQELPGWGVMGQEKAWELYPSVLFNLALPVAGKAKHPRVLALGWPLARLTSNSG
jgi:hypothetical protein